MIIFVSPWLLSVQQSSPALAQGGNSWSHTTTQDFNSCGPVLSNTSVTTAAGGEVRLTALIEDYFDETTLNSTRWITGTGTGGNGIPPRIENGVLLVNRSWISSTTSITQTDLPVAVEGRVRFISPSQIPGIDGFVDVGLGDAANVNVTKSLDSNALFITDANNVVMVNSYQPGYYPDTSGRQRETVTGFDWTQFHDIRIEVASNQVNYYVDGIFQRTHLLSTSLTAIPLHLWFFSLNPNYEFAAEWLRLARYPNSGQFTSCPIDTGATTSWGSLAWQGSTPAGGAVTFETRSSTDALNWSTWESLGASNIVTSPAGRYLQYRTTLTTADQTLSPEIRQVVVTGAGNHHNAPQHRQFTGSGHRAHDSSD
ncbi:MAG: hypothetical protein HC875_32140 [Anaerolineales bacterium]|nr:hypothetical protein [Anaerolineales bacterium]